MENLVKRYFWMVNLAVLAIIAFLAARVVNNMSAGYIIGLPTNPKVVTDKPNVRAGGPLTGPNEWATAINERNLFNSQPVDPADEATVAEVEPTLPDTPPGEGDECKAADGKLGLLATMVAQPEMWSMAVINDGESPDNRLVRIGQPLTGGYEVKQIYRQRLVVSRSGQYECIDLGSQGQKGTASTSSSSSTTNYASTPEASGGDKEEASTATGGAEFKEHVRKTGANSYEIDVDFIKEQMNNLNELARQARVIPHYRDGKPQGFKLVGVRPGSLYSHLGVRSGDVIKGINGEEITSPNKALELVDKLQKPGQWSIEIERRGKRQTMDYLTK
ncbi:MAG: hypothetical protein EXR76_05400 [Myxococcales bacterium]|nr:hypothetical protein [Myxococcales bacterium]